MTSRDLLLDAIAENSSLGVLMFLLRVAITFHPARATKLQQLRCCAPNGTQSRKSKMHRRPPSDGGNGTAALHYSLV